MKTTEDPNKTIFNPNENMDYNAAGVTAVYVDRTVRSGERYFKAMDAAHRSAESEQVIAADDFVLSTRECSSHILREYLMNNKEPYQHFVKVYEGMEEAPRLLLQGVVKEIRATSRCILQDEDPKDYVPTVPALYSLGLRLPDDMPQITKSDWEEIYTQVEKWEATNRMYTSKDVDNAANAVETVGKMIVGTGFAIKEPKVVAVGGITVGAGAAIKAANGAFGYIADKIYGNR